MIIFIVDQSVNYFINSSISCLVYKMSENSKQSSNVLFCPQENQKIFTFKKLESENEDFSLKILKLIN